MRSKTETTNYAQMGIAALLPGMQFMIEKMQQQLDEMRSHLDLLQNEAYDSPLKTAGPGRGSWAKLTAEERSAEMKRRFKIREQKKAAALDEQKREQKRAKLSEYRKRAWAKKTRAEKKAWVAKMQTAKAKTLEVLAS